MSDQVRDARQVYHFWVDDSILDIFGAQLGAYGLAVYMALARRAKRGTSWPSIRRLRQDTGMSAFSVRKALKLCEALGLITIEARHTADGDSTSNLYTLCDLSHLSGRSTTLHAGGTASDGGGTLHNAGGVLRDTQEGTPSDVPEVVSLEGVSKGSTTNTNNSSMTLDASPLEEGEKLAADDWLLLLLEDYGKDLNVEALNDAEWFNNLANSFPTFDKTWVSLALAGLVAYHRENLDNVPKTHAAWKRRVRKHLNIYYDQHVRRESYGNSQKH